MCDGAVDRAASSGDGSKSPNDPISLRPSSVAALASPSPSGSAPASSDPRQHQPLPMRACENFGRTSSLFLPQCVQVKLGSMSESRTSSPRRQRWFRLMAAAVIAVTVQHVATPDSRISPKVIFC
jgi:hypothetical protein